MDDLSNRHDNDTLQQILMLFDFHHNKDVYNFVYSPQTSIDNVIKKLETKFEQWFVLFWLIFHYS